MGDLIGAKFEVVTGKAPTTPVCSVALGDESGAEPNTGVIDELGNGVPSEDWIGVGAEEGPTGGRGTEVKVGAVVGRFIEAAFGGAAGDGKPSCGTACLGPGGGTIGGVVCPMLPKPKDAGTLEGAPGHPEENPEGPNGLSGGGPVGPLDRG